MNAQEPRASDGPMEVMGRQVEKEKRDSQCSRSKPIPFRIRVELPDASIEYVTGMVSKEQAMQCIANDAPVWITKPDRLTTSKA
jgi:hypothetical protein